MPVSELDADKNPVRGYVLGNEYISQSDGTSFGYYLNDEQGSVRYLTGSDGSIRNHYRYSAFGETITAEETVPNRLRYNGQMAEGLTGLYYLRARYYNASLGRFTQEDVIYNDGLNLYAYCSSNPVMYADPSGYACEPKEGAENSKSGSNTKTLFRGDRASVVPDDVFKNGFKPKGTHNDALLHTKSNTTAGNFVSTSGDIVIATEFAGKNGYVYVIRTNNYVDINSIYGAGAYFPEQMEFSIPGGIKPYEIVGAYKKQGGKIIGDFIPNPNFGGN